METGVDTCRLCGGQAYFQFDGTVRGSYKIGYFLCGGCGFLQTERPFWLTEAYTESINITDTGLVHRNLWLSGVTAMITLFVFSKRARGLDFGGGYGLFVRLMRDKGFDFRWEDPWTKNIFARGFEYKSGDEVDLVTCFEAFEHFVDPPKEIESMLERGRNILFSTQLLPVPIPKPQDWWYYDLENGQHIAFYTDKALSWLARRYGLHLSSAWSVHMLSEKKIPGPVFRALVAAGRMGLDKIVAPWRNSCIVEDMEMLKNRKICERQAIEAGE